MYDLPTPSSGSLCLPIYNILRPGGSSVRDVGHHSSESPGYPLGYQSFDTTPNTSTKLTRAEKDLMEKFRAAALSISLLYKSSLSTSKRAYSAGYSTCLADVLQMIQHGLSASHPANDGALGGGGPEMTIGRIMDWVEARQETIRLEEEDQDGVNEDDIGDGAAAAGSAYNSSNKPRETFGDRMGSQGPGVMSKSGSHPNGAPSGSSGSANNRFTQLIASSSMKRTGSAPINMRPVPLTNPASGPVNTSDGSSSTGSAGDQPIASSSSSSSAFCNSVAPARSEQQSNFLPASRLSAGKTDRPMLSTSNLADRTSFSVPPPTRPSSVRPSEETPSTSSTHPPFQTLQNKPLPQSSSPSFISSSSLSPVFPPKQRQASSITVDTNSAPSASLNPMVHSSPLAPRPTSLSLSSRSTTPANFPPAPQSSTTTTAFAPESTLTDAQSSSFPSPKAASPILFPPSKPSFTFGLPSDPFSEALSSTVDSPPAGIVSMSGPTANGIFSGVSIPHQVGVGAGGNGGSTGEREPTGSKRRYAAMMAATGAGPMVVGTSGASASAGSGGMDDVGDITTTIASTGSVGGGRRKGSRRPVKAVGVGRDVGSMEGVEENEEREKKRSARRRD
ncbi:hypothetical protein [Phaffia rhodozyma]|uniref:Uncharacterized protein n=1 Tax=Phaffia rhodozyma TaxID=264483 RepID=A0A0F7SFK8_PHARH|nr:hypothetical protein [Phaffia rhodozyma]